MELDNLKQTWKESEKLQKPSNQNILELIQHKSSGPVAALKKGFRRQMILIPFVVVIIINNFRHRQIWNDVVFWCYLVFCAALCLFFYFNYRTVRNMENKEGVIKANLEQQVIILEKRMKWHPVAIRIVLMFFIILIEVITKFASEPMVEKWHRVPLPLRLLVYIALFLFQYYGSRFKRQRKYGRHLSYLKELLREMQ